MAKESECSLPRSQHLTCPCPEPD